MKDEAEPEGIRHPWQTPPAEGEAIEVAEGILWMRLPLPMALDHVNVYALRDEDGWCLVDTGFDTGKTRAIWERLLAGPLSGAPVTKLIVTHHHPDHVGLAGWFQEMGAELLATRTAWLMARMLTLDVQDRPVPETIAFWRRMGMAETELAERLEERPFNFADIVAPMPLGFTRIVAGDVLSIGGRDWTVRTGGGHAAEQATLWCRSGQLVLGADMLLPGISPNIGVYPTEPEADPLSDWFDACEVLGPQATDAQLVLPGHKLPFRGLQLRLRQLSENHETALDRLRAYLSVPHTAAECFAPIFGRAIRKPEYGLALAETVAHLNHLHQMGEVACDRTAEPWLWRMA